MKPGTDGLYGDFALELLVESGVDLPHSALTENVDKADVSDGPADQVHMFLLNPDPLSK